MMLDNVAYVRKRTHEEPPPVEQWSIGAADRRLQFIAQAWDHLSTGQRWSLYFRAVSMWYMALLKRNWWR